MPKRKWTNNKSVNVDGKTPMYRFLNGVDDNGQVWPRYHQQWQTYGRAQRLGYLDDDGYLTQAGADFLSKND